MTDFFWSTPSGESHDVRCEGGETVEVFPKVVSAIAADAGNFVWADPTSVQAGNVFNNWPDLAAAILAVRGQKTVTIVFANPTITAGAWPDITDVTFLAGETTPLGVVTIANGATFTSVHKLTLDGVVFEYAGTAVPFISLSGTQLLEVNLRNVGQIAQSGGKPFVSLAGSSTLVSFNDPGVWAAGTIAVAAVGATVDMFLFDGSALNAGAISATALGTVNLALDGASQPGLDGAAVGTITPSIQLLDPQPTFVFRPGATGILDGNVFTTWPSLMAAVARTAGPRTIVVDDSLAPAHMTTVAGSGVAAWDLDNVTLLGQFNSPTFTLNIDVGAVISSSSLTIGNGLLVKNSAVNCWAPVNGAVLLLTEGAQIESIAGATAFLHCTDSFTEIFLQHFGVLGDGTNNVVSVDTTKNVLLGVFSGSNVLAHALGGLGTATIQDRDAISLVSLTQDITTLAFSNASAFTNVNQASGNTGTGTGTVSAVTGNVQKQMSGKVLVIANIAGTTSAGTTVTLQLVRDAATNIGNAIVETTLSAGDGFHGSIAFVDTLPDGAPHTYKVTATAGAGNITPGGANSCQILATELPT